MSFPTLPWDPGFTPPGVDKNLVDEITGVVQGVTNVATGMASEVAGQVAGDAAAQAVKDVGAAAAAVEAAGGGIVSGAAGAIANAPAGGDLVAGIQAAAKASAEAAFQAALPALQDRIAHAAEKAMADQLKEIVGDSQPPVASIPKADLKKLDAWERALRTFGQGLLLTVLGAIVQVLGQLTTNGTSIDFFHKDGWVVVGTMFTAAVVTSVFSYVMRYVKEPAGAAIDSSTKTP